MKMYTTSAPGPLFADTTARLRREGYLADEVPHFWYDTKYVNRTMRFNSDPTAQRPDGTGAQTVQGYHSVDFTLYGIEPGLHSPYKSAHKTLRDHGEYAATWEQWGIFVGAMFDVARETPDFTGADDTLVRITGSYDPLGKYAPKQDDGSAFNTSRDVFTWRTMGQYSRDNRQRQTPVISCRAHRWERRSAERMAACTKCGTGYRYL